MAKEVWLYNPDDEPDGYQYGGCRIDLEANGATKLSKPADWNNERNGPWNAQAAAAHLIDHLGQWGVAIVSGPVKGGKAQSEADQEIVKTAEAIYLRRTGEWAADVIAGYNQRAKPYTDADLPGPKKNEEESSAFDWWAKNKKRVA